MAADEIAVTVVCAAAPHRVVSIELRLPAGSTVAQAVAASGVTAALAFDEASRLEAGVWGRLVPGDTALHDHDRVELTRPLTVDPKEARRLRYQRDRNVSRTKRRGAAP